MSDYVRHKIEQQFESVENFKKLFSERAVSLFGSGWVWLVFDGAQLKIWSGSNASCPIAENLVPLLTVDVWEHAYYLDYQNRRAEFIDMYWNVVDWSFVEQAMREAMSAQDAAERLKKLAEKKERAKQDAESSADKKH